MLNVNIASAEAGFLQFKRGEFHTMTLRLPVMVVVHIKTLPPPCFMKRMTPIMSVGRALSLPRLDLSQPLSREAIGLAQESFVRYGAVRIPAGQIPKSHLQDVFSKVSHTVPLIALT